MCNNIGIYRNFRLLNRVNLSDKDLAKMLSLARVDGLKDMKMLKDLLSYAIPARTRQAETIEKTRKGGKCLYHYSEGYIESVEIVLLKNKFCDTVRIDILTVKQ